MMIDGAEAVNGRDRGVVIGFAKKKPGSKEPGLRYWPREADTITFQEGLLSVRATGGGGQMRNANAQRTNIMVRRDALQQPLSPHVSHAETGGKVGPSKSAAALASIGFGECRIRKNTKLKSRRFAVQKFSRTAAPVTTRYEG